MKYSDEQITKMENYLPKIRRSLGWSKAVLSEKLDVCCATINNIERKRFGMSTIQYLAIVKVIEDEIKERNHDETFIARFLLNHVVNGSQLYTDVFDDVMENVDKFLNRIIYNKSLEKRIEICNQFKKHVVDCKLRHIKH